jgi:hypothetical protein
MEFVGQTIEINGYKLSLARRRKGRAIQRGGPARRAHGRDAPPGPVHRLSRSKTLCVNLTVVPFGAPR